MKKLSKKVVHVNNGGEPITEELVDFLNKIVEIVDKMEKPKMSKAKEILLDELNEQGHPEKVEDVIFWALEYYAESEPKGTWGRTIAYAIKERILEEEDDKSKYIKPIGKSFESPYSKLIRTRQQSNKKR